MNSSGNAYDVSQLTIETGEYKPIYSIPLTRTAPAMEEINSAGISPVDSKAYATVKIDGDYFLMRHDPRYVEFVAKLPPPKKFDNKNVGYNTGAFGSSGDYYLVTKGPKVQHMIVIKGLDAVDGQKYRGTAPDWKDTLEGFSLGGSDWIADMAIATGDFDGSGQIVDYAFMLDKTPIMYVVKVVPQSNILWKLKTTGDGLKPAAKNGFGAAWSFKDRVFFASNFGRGVYEVDKKSINLVDLTVKMIYVGKSRATTKNDGMNCLSTESPWPEQGDCDDGFVQVDAVNGQCPAGSTQQ